MTPAAATAVVPLFLQYGALGLLAAVLAGFGFFLYRLLAYIKELVDVVRDASSTASAGLASVEGRLETLVERQESTIEALGRIERSNDAEHRTTQNQILMLARSKSPYPGTIAR